MSGCVPISTKEVVQNNFPVCSRIRCDRVFICASALPSVLFDSLISTDGNAEAQMRIREVVLDHVLTGRTAEQRYDRFPFAGVTGAVDSVFDDAARVDAE